MSAATETVIDIGLIDSKWPSVVLKDKDGNIVAMLMLHNSVPQLELTIDEGYRGQHKWLELAETMKECVSKCRPYYAISPNEKVAFMCKMMGMKEIEGAKVFIME